MSWSSNPNVGGNLFPSELSVEELPFRQCLQQLFSKIYKAHLFTLKQTVPLNWCHPNVVSRQLLDLLLCNMNAQPRTIGHSKKIVLLCVHI